MGFDKREEKIKDYPRFLQNYFYSAKQGREEKIKEFYSVVPENSIILEGASGKVSRIREFNSCNSTIKMLVGVDLLIDSIKLNNDLDFRIIANLENLPFKKGSFDFVNLPHVVEHLQNPDKVFKEVDHVLKRDGIVLVSTKNIYNPFMAVNKILPLNLRYWVKKKILKLPGHFLDTFPAPYRCNSATQLRKAFASLGFNEEFVWHWGWPLVLNPPAGLFFSMIYEKLTDIKCLNIFKPNVWGRYRKISWRALNSGGKKLN